MRSSHHFFICLPTATATTIVLASRAAPTASAISMVGLLNLLITNIIITI